MDKAVDRSSGADDAAGAAGIGAPVAAVRYPDIDPPMLADWLRRAQPGARICYFTGLSAAHGNKVLNDRLYEEAERGMLYLVQKRRRGADGSPRDFDYLAIRSSRPVHDGRGAAARRPRSIGEQADALFRSRETGRGI
jgi:hypothetical protein